MAPKIVRRRLVPGHDRLAGAVGDPGGPHPGQQVDMRLVFGQHHRAIRQVADLLPQGDKDLVAVGVAACDQPGSPPAGDLTHPPVQGAEADGGTAKPLVQPRNRPRLGIGQQPADPLAELWTAQPGPASSGPVAQAGDAVGVVAVEAAPHGRRVLAERLGDGAGRPAAV
jgi:hypothetical protein